MGDPLPAPASVERVDAPEGLPLLRGLRVRWEAIEDRGVVTDTTETLWLDRAGHLKLSTVENILGVEQIGLVGVEQADSDYAGGQSADHDPDVLQQLLGLKAGADFAHGVAKIHHHGNTLYPKLEELTGQYVSWHRSGGIRLARTQHDLDWFNYMRGIARNVGFRMEIIDPAEISRINPFMNTDGVLAGAWTMDDGHADPSGLTHAMARGATDMGATIVRHNRVIDIRLLASGEWEVLTEQGSVIAEAVVNAAGCFARQVAQFF